IIANWKLHPQSYFAAEKLARGVLAELKKIKNSSDAVLCPPFPWLTDFSHKMKGVKWGAQDVFWENEGPYTGEVSPKMLKNSGVGYAIIGHSERRDFAFETDEIINRKLKAALKSGLKAVLCVGERERKEPNFQNYVREQLKADLKGVSAAFAKRLIVAYEPVWAIGTGRAVKARELFEMATFIRRSLLDILGKKAAYNTPVLYGGSVDSGNAGGFMGSGGVNGFLVGGASLSAREFAKIVRIADEKR
ncbi:MAG: triose-phosphate isomerase, partial [Candidatus Niyogibacteria bacterium]|nr:triose-phosphate isomerase [Candidatus Niyogibacteria bacterium]